MNRIRVLPTLILAGVLSVNAYHIQAQENLTIHLQDGSEQSFPLSGIRKLTFLDGSLWLTQLNDEGQSYHCSEVRKLTFGNGATGISSPLAGKADTYIFVDESTGNIQTANTAAGTLAVVYGPDGILLFQGRVDENGCLETGSLASGIYMLRINNHVFKFRRP